MTIKAALFDLDGVVFDTERQYSIFWGMIGEEYHPEIPHFSSLIKGQTLVQIYDRYFGHVKEEQERITARLDAFERDMDYEYIEGFEDFVKDLRRNGVKTAVVTSSNMQKMKNVYAQHPEFEGYFDCILTSEDFAKSKPAPDCYLKGAACFGAKPEECVGFEDSINGLKAVRAAGQFTLGLATTNPREVVSPLSDYVIDNYLGIKYIDLAQIVGVSR